MACRSNPAALNWTEAEDNIVRRWYPTGGAPSCNTRLTNRTNSAITQRAERLEVNRNRWVILDWDAVLRAGAVDGV